MAYDLSGFDPSFFCDHGEPYDTDRGPSDRPDTVWQAIISMSDEDWNRIASDLFDLENPDFLTPETVLERIRDVNTCSNLNSPVTVWIDEDGYETIEVY
jgi:hypothetical protein